MAGLMCATAAHAGTFFFDFNTDPSTSGLLTISGAGSWVPAGGAGSSTNSSDGYLELTDGTSQATTIIFSDFDSGSVVQAFTFEADLQIGNGTQSPADGFSINYCRASDPVLTGGAFATGPNCEAGLPEEGTQTGVGIGFDAWASGGSSPYCDEANQSIGPDIIAISVRVDGILYFQLPMTTQNGAVTDPTSLQTGAYDGTGSTANLGWAHLKVSLDANAKLSVWWKGTQLINQYQVPSYYPSAGRLVFAGRCGGSWENQNVDNISITTVAAALAQVGNVTGLPDGFSISASDSGASVVNASTASATLNGTAVSGMTSSKSGTTTTFTYHGFPTLLTAGATNTLVLNFKDGNGNAISATRTFVTPTFGVLDPSWAVTGVGTTPGFRLLPWQSGAEPNSVYWVEEQLEGLHGANSADLTGVNDSGFIDFKNVLNFNISPAVTGGGDAGNFQTANGYPDSTFPGIPGANTLTGSSALLVHAFVQFASAGLYTMGVNSDDGFVVTAGINPRDRLATVLEHTTAGAVRPTRCSRSRFLPRAPTRLRCAGKTATANCRATAPTSNGSP